MAPEAPLANRPASDSDSPNAGVDPKPSEGPAVLRSGLREDQALGGQPDRILPGCL